MTTVRRRGGDVAIVCVGHGSLTIPARAAEELLAGLLDLWDSPDDELVTIDTAAVSELVGDFRRPAGFEP